MASGFFRLAPAVNVAMPDKLIDKSTGTGGPTRLLPAADTRR